MKNTVFDYFIVLLKGMAMGAADVVPGVSGGTIAFITGIYERWVAALSSIGLDAIKKLFNSGSLTAGIAAAWRHVDGTFMVSLFAGIIVSMLSLAKVIKWLMEHQPIALWSFFFGLVVASVIILMRQVRAAEEMNAKTLVLFIIGALVAGGISLIPTGQTAELSYVFLFFAGALAICAMILPGVSGSFILVLIGAYEVFINALSAVNIAALASFGVGAAIGLLSFARLLKWLFARYHTATLSLMTGFVAGSLVKIWPWKTDVLPRLPSMSMSADQIGTGIVMMVVGFALILMMEAVANKLGSGNAPAH